MNYAKMTKAELVKELKSYRSTIDTISGQPLGLPTQSLNEQQRLLHEVQALHSELEVQSVEMQNMRQALDETRKRYTAIYDLSPVGHVTLNSEGHIKEINLTAASLLCVERSRLIDISFTNFVEKGNIQKFQDHLWQCKHSNNKVITEVTLTVGGRHVMALLLSASQHITEQNAELCRMAIVDIFPHKSAEITPKGAEENFQEPVEANNDAIFIMDAETGIILDINKPVEALIGRPAVDVVGMHFTKLHPEGAERYKDVFEVHSQTKEVKVNAEDLVICHKDGRRIKVEISTSIIEFEGGKRIIQAIFKDLTGHNSLMEEYSYC